MTLPPPSREIHAHAERFVPWGPNHQPKARRDPDLLHCTSLHDRCGMQLGASWQRMSPAASRSRPASKPSRSSATRFGRYHCRAQTTARYESQLAEAKAAYDRAPTNADSIIWYARRLGYLGRIREAIDVYTRGIALYPDNPWLYRHRGHRYISVRELDRAAADLERATSLTQGKPDQVEPDGQPNARNMPIGTLHSNIAYHLALAYYLKGDFARATTGLPPRDRRRAQRRPPRIDRPLAVHESPPSWPRRGGGGGARSRSSAR